MARPLRIEYHGAWYHVMNRGANRNTIFHNSKDFQLFFDLLGQAHERFGVEIHTYCLMSNHYHLLIRTPHSNLSKAMRHINGLFTQKHNNLQNKDGPLFRGRYKAILVEAESYLLTLSCYIHLNPVTAKIVDKPEDYFWSSYKCYFSKRHRPSWLYCDEILDRFNIYDPIERKGLPSTLPSGSGEQAPENNQLLYRGESPVFQTGVLQKFKEFVNEGVDDEIQDFYNQSKLFPVLGSKTFIQKMNCEHLKSTPSPHLPEHSSITKTFLPSVEEIIENVANYFKINTSEIRRNIKRTSKNMPRNVAIYLALKFSGQDRKVISSLFDGVSYLSLSAIGRRVALAFKNDAKLLKDVEKLEKRFSSRFNLIS